MSYDKYLAVGAGREPGNNELTMEQDWWSEGS